MYLLRNRFLLHYTSTPFSSSVPLTDTSTHRAEPSSRRTCHWWVTGPPVLLAQLLLAEFDFRGVQGWCPADS